MIVAEETSKKVEKPQAKLIIFIDALDYKEVHGWGKEFAKRYEPNVPRCTPNIISQALTGKPREQLPFMRSTPLVGPRLSRLGNDTILHYAASKGKVLQYGIPLCSGIDLGEGSVSCHDNLLQSQHTPPELTFPMVRKDFEGDLDGVFEAYVDDLRQMFGAIRNIMRKGQYDFIFLGYQALDAYTHWYDEPRRVALQKLLWEELDRVRKLGVEILFFSDHGSVKKKVLFHINKWLMEMGWLKCDVNYELLDVHNKVSPSDAFETDVCLWDVFAKVLQGTKFYCADAFDCMIDATEEATEEDKALLKGQLLATGLFDNVWAREELFKEFHKDTPAIIPEPSQGVVVSANVHKDAETGRNMGTLRGGWHSKDATFGCTIPLKATVKEPSDLFAYMKEFIDSSPSSKRLYDERVATGLKALGYI